MALWCRWGEAGTLTATLFLAPGNPILGVPGQGTRNPCRQLSPLYMYYVHNSNVYWQMSRPVEMRCQPVSFH